jgi:hypothetical protein
MLGACSGSTCDHCGRPVRQLYMVHDSVWVKAFPPDYSPWLMNLHVGCLERRLGRRLTSRDFYYPPLHRASAAERRKQLAERAEVRRLLAAKRAAS